MWHWKVVLIEAIHERPVLASNWTDLSPFSIHLATKLMLKVELTLWKERIIKLNIVFHRRQLEQQFLLLSIFLFTSLGFTSCYFMFLLFRLHFRASNLLFIQSNEPRITLFCLFIFNYIFFRASVSSIWLTVESWFPAKSTELKNDFR